MTDGAPNPTPDGRACCVAAVCPKHSGSSLPLAEVERCARAMVINHERHIQDGYRLMGSSAIWRRKDGLLTARFVYRRRGGGAALGTISYVLRDIAG